MMHTEKETIMHRLSKYLLLVALLVFVLACSLVTQPIKDVQNVAGTAESLATSMPNIASTVESAATGMPDIASTIEAAGTKLPDLGQMFDPKGTPVSEWNGIPIMPQATVGQEFADAKSYSFKTNVTVQEVQDYYNTELVKLGWSSTMSLPGSSNGAVMLFSKDGAALTITISMVDGSTVVVLTQLAS
jgi:hypothetical protein